MHPSRTMHERCTSPQLWRWPPITTSTGATFHISPHWWGSALSYLHLHKRMPMLDFEENFTYAQRATAKRPRTAILGNRASPLQRIRFCPPIISVGALLISHWRLRTCLTLSQSKQYLLPSTLHGGVPLSRAPAKLTRGLSSKFLGPSFLSNSTSCGWSIEGTTCKYQRHGWGNAPPCRSFAAFTPSCTQM